MTLSLGYKPLTLTPLITPFNETGPDVPAILGMVRRQMIAGVDGIVLLDVVGEGQSLSSGERELVISTCIQAAKPYLRVIVATGTNSTEGTIDRCRRAEQMGADGLLITVPYYSKPTLAGTIDHFREVAASVSVPVIIDDSPEMTASDHGNRLLEGLVPEPSIFGICHGHARLGYFTNLPDALRQRFFHFSRDDATLAEFMRGGGKRSYLTFGECGSVRHPDAHFDTTGARTTQRPGRGHGCCFKSSGRSWPACAQSGQCSHQPSCTGRAIAAGRR